MSTRAAVLLPSLLLALPAAAEGPDAVEVMRANYQVSRTQDSISRATYTLVSSGGQKRERKTLSYSKLLPNGQDNMRLTRFLSPADVKGTGILLVEHSGADDDMWIWLPALRKVRRLVSSNKRDSFLGTDLSYGDVIGHRVEDWTHRIVGEEAVDGAPCHVVESLPRSEAVQSHSGYSKRKSWIRKDNAVAVRGEFWDEAGRPVKRTRGSEIRQTDAAANKWQAMSIVAENAQNGHSTHIHVDELQVNQRISDETFTTRALERE
jgi:uncharacterized protein